MKRRPSPLNILAFCAIFIVLFADKIYAVEFSPDEQKWINQEPRLRFSEVEWQPLSYTDEFPVYKGIIADYLEIPSTHAGLKMEYIKSKTWQEVLDKFGNNEIDLIPALSKEDDIGAEVLFTDSYISFPLVIATRNDIDFISYTHELKGKKVGVGKGYTSYYFLKKNHPEIELTTTDDVLQGLKMLDKGEIDAFVGHLAVIIYTITNSNLDVKIAGKTEFVFEHRMGLSPKHAPAVSIFNKIFAGMTKEKHNHIYNKWVKIGVQKNDYSLVWKISIGTGLVLFGFCYWNRKLSIEKERAQQALNDLNLLKEQLVEKNEALNQLAVTDQLTGLYNRLKLDATLKGEFERSERYTHAFGIILVDIDNFKEVNDTHGHQTGDKILLNFAELLMNHTRKTDIVGRWGGEEFLIICPETCETGIMKLAKNLCGIIQKHKFPVILSKTASFGVALYRQGDSIQTIIKRSDEALYNAKESGKNCVKLG
jgi:diguanylate cyclase (GGDEF)-like protein